MRKYTIAILAAAALFSTESSGAPKKTPHAAAPAPAVTAPAAPAVACTNPDEFAVQPPVVPYTTLTGEALRQYIDAFNEVGSGHQGYDDFDRLDLYHPRPDVTVWTFFKNGCLIQAPIPATEMHEKIMERLHGRGA